jgi:hypothetical protein
MGHTNDFVFFSLLNALRHQWNTNNFNSKLIDS